jgi:hypothetical protein
LLRIDDMSEARLVLTDALISESLRRSKHGEKLGVNSGSKPGERDTARVSEAPESQQTKSMDVAAGEDRRARASARENESWRR